MPGTLGGTYGGGPLACAAAVATLDVIEGEGLLQNAEARGRQLVAVSAHHTQNMRICRALGRFCSVRPPAEARGWQLVALCAHSRIRRVWRTQKSCHMAQPVCLAVQAAGLR